MKCLILAAGRGSRLSEEGIAKPLLRVAGLPLIERTILTAHQAGLQDFYIVAGYGAERFKQFLSELPLRRDLKLAPVSVPVQSPPGRPGSGYQIALAQSGRRGHHDTWIGCGQLR